MQAREVLEKRRCCNAEPPGACPFPDRCLSANAASLTKADADIAALRAAGFRIVPEGPTQAMIEAAIIKTGHGAGLCVAIYRAMLAASEPPHLTEGHNHE